MSCPVVVFAGLGSPAAVLAESVTRVRDALDEDRHHVFVVDPAATTALEAALNLPASSHVESGWSNFMEGMAERLLADLASELEATEGHSAHSTRGMERLSISPTSLCGCTSWESLRLEGSGQNGCWTASNTHLTTHEGPSLADLVLGLGLIERAANVQVQFQDDGVVELHRDGGAPIRLLPASGGGAFRWSALEATFSRSGWPHQLNTPTTVRADRRGGRPASSVPGASRQLVDGRRGGRHRSRGSAATNHLSRRDSLRPRQRPRFGCLK